MNNSCAFVTKIIFAFLTAQNCLLNAQRILWLEIREFWACNIYIVYTQQLTALTTEVCNFTQCKSYPFHCKRTTFALHFGLRCIANGASLPSKSCPFGVQRSSNWIKTWCRTLQKLIKTALQISIIDFYFVILFYYMSYICILFHNKHLMQKTVFQLIQRAICPL